MQTNKTRFVAIFLLTLGLLILIGVPQNLLFISEVTEDSALIELLEQTNSINFKNQIYDCVKIDGQYHFGELVERDNKLYLRSYRNILNQQIKKNQSLNKTKKVSQLKLKRSQLTKLCQFAEVESKQQENPLIFLYNNINNGYIADLVPDIEITSAQVAGKDLKLVIRYPVNVGSLKLVYNGEEYFSDNKEYEVSIGKLSIGEYQLSLTPFLNKSGEGLQGQEIKISWKVTPNTNPQETPSASPSSPVTNPTPTNTNNPQPTPTPSATSNPSPSPTVIPSNFQIGDRIILIKQTNVRATSGLSGTLLGTQPIGSKGLITAGPSNVDNITWWTVNFDSGVDGKCGEDNYQIFTETQPSPTPSASSSPSPSPTTVPSNFKIGDRISLIKQANIRATAGLSGTLLGTQPVGASGVITAGPSRVDNFTWWTVNFDSGVDGKCGEDNYQLATVAQCLSGETENRTMFRLASVPSGNRCQSETQTRTCTSNAWGNWSGTYSFSSCYVEGERWNPPAIVDGKITINSNSSLNNISFNNLSLNSNGMRLFINGTASSRPNSFIYNVSVDGYNGRPAGSCLWPKGLPNTFNAPAELVNKQCDVAVTRLENGSYTAPDVDIAKIWGTPGHTLLKNLDIKNAFKLLSSSHTDTIQFYGPDYNVPQDNWIVVQDSNIKNSDDNLFIGGDFRAAGVVFQNVLFDYESWFNQDCNNRITARRYYEKNAYGGCGKGNNSGGMPKWMKKSADIWLINVTTTGNFKNFEWGGNLSDLDSKKVVIRINTNAKAEANSNFLHNGNIVSRSGSVCDYPSIEAALADKNPNDNLPMAGCGNFELPPFIQLSCAGWANPPAGCESKRGKL